MSTNYSRPLPRGACIKIKQSRTSHILYLQWTKTGSPSTRRDLTEFTNSRKSEESSGTPWSGHATYCRCVTVCSSPVCEDGVGWVSQSRRWALPLRCQPGGPVPSVLSPLCTALLWPAIPLSSHPSVSSGRVAFPLSGTVISFRCSYGTLPCGPFYTKWLWWDTCSIMFAI